MLIISDTRTKIPPMNNLRVVELKFSIGLDSARGLMGREASHERIVYLDMSHIQAILKWIIIIVLERNGLEHGSG